MNGNKQLSDAARTVLINKDKDQSLDPSQDSLAQYLALSPVRLFQRRHQLNSLTFPASVGKPNVNMNAQAACSVAIIFPLIPTPYCDATPASIMGRMFEMQELQEEVQ
jgi:hypothetical protein